MNLKSFVNMLPDYNQNIANNGQSLNQCCQLFSEPGTEILFFRY